MAALARRPRVELSQQAPGIESNQRLGRHRWIVEACLSWLLNNRRLAFVCCSVELVGVLVIGTASLVDRAAFPKATVWSLYGIGYGFVPLVLPILGLWWLRRARDRA